MSGGAGTERGKKMDELISREKVMQLARDVTLEGGIKHRCIDATAVATIKSEPRRKRGKWLDEYKRQKCSVCLYRGFRSWKYCPHCGSKMEAT